MCTPLSNSSSFFSQFISLLVLVVLGVKWGQDRRQLFLYTVHPATSQTMWSILPLAAKPSSAFKAWGGSTFKPAPSLLLCDGCCRGTCSIYLFCDKWTHQHIGLHNNSTFTVTIPLVLWLHPKTDLDRCCVASQTNKGQSRIVSTRTLLSLGLGVEGDGRVERSRWRRVWPLILFCIGVGRLHVVSLHPPPPLPVKRISCPCWLWTICCSK